MTYNSTHWMLAWFRLPRAGVAAAFPTEESCLARVTEVRWPSGVHCPRCGGGNIGYIDARKTYRCVACRYQFTPTAGTLLHHTRVALSRWFAAAEWIIEANAESPWINYPTVHMLKDQFSISYAAACALKKKLKADLLSDSGGLVGKCIMTEPAIEVPEELQNCEEHKFLWVCRRYEDARACTRSPARVEISR